jgi:outer membrane cobalamin receptor
MRQFVFITIFLAAICAGESLDYTDLKVFAEGTPVVYQGVGAEAEPFFAETYWPSGSITTNCAYELSWSSLYAQSTAFSYRDRKPEEFSLAVGEETGLGERPNSGYSRTFLKMGFLTVPRADLSVRYLLDLSNNNYGLPGPVPPDGQKGQFSGDYDSSSLTDHFQEAERNAAAFLTYLPTQNKAVRFSFQYKNYQTKTKQTTQLKSSGTVFDAYTRTAVDRLTNKIAYGDRTAGWIYYRCGLDFAQDQVQSVYQKRDTNNLKITELNFKTFGETALWGELEFFKNERLTFSYSDRLEKHNLYPEQYAQKLGCELRVLKELTLKLAKSNYSTPPDINSLYYPDYGNEDLLPARTVEHNAGLFWRSDALDLSFDILRREEEDIIMSVPSDNGRYYAKNISEAQLKGERWDFSWKIFDTRLVLDGSFIKQRGTYTRLKRKQYYVPYGTESIEGEQMPDLPEEKSALGLAAKITERFSCRLETFYVGERINYYEKLGAPPFDPKVYTVIKELKPYRLWNCCLNYQCSDYLRLFLNFLNFTNIRYETGFGEQSADGYYDRDYPGPGSAVCLGGKGVF